MAEISGLVGITLAGLPHNDKNQASSPDLLPKVRDISPGANGISATSFGRQPVRLAFNPVDEGVKLLKLLQRGGSNNIVPFLRGVSQAPADKKVWLIEKGIQIMGGATKFINLLKPFAPAFAAFAQRLNPVLLPAAVLQELDGWFGSGAQLSSGELPFREPTRPRPETKPPITPMDFPHQTPYGNPYPLYPEPAVPVKSAEPTIRIPTEAQVTAKIKLQSAQSDLAWAKEAVDQAFARPPILGLESFREDVTKLGAAVKAYDKAIAAARAVGLENVDALVKQFQRTASQALDLLARAPQRQAQLKAADDKRAANLYPEGAPQTPEEIRREINFGSLQRFFTYEGGVSGMVEKGLIKTPADFAVLFGRKNFQQEELNLFAKSLQNFIDNPGQSGKDLVKAAGFILRNIQAHKDALMSFRFPDPDALEKAAKPDSPLLNPKKDPLIGSPNIGSPNDPFKRPVDDDAPKLPNYSPKPDDQSTKQKPLLNPVPQPQEKPVGEPRTGDPSDLWPSASGTGPSEDGGVPNPAQPPDASASAVPTDGSASSSGESPDTPSPAESFLARRLQEAAPEGSRLFERLKAEGWTFSVSHNKPYAVAPSGNAYPLSTDALPSEAKSFNRGFTQSWKTTVQQNLDKALKAESGEIRWPGPGNVIKLDPKPGN